MRGKCKRCRSGHRPDASSDGPGVGRVIDPTLGVYPRRLGPGSRTGPSGPSGPGAAEAHFTGHGATAIIIAQKISAPRAQRRVPLAACPPVSCAGCRARSRMCLPSRRDRMNIAQRETLGSRGRYVSLSPGGTIEGSVVPAGLEMDGASPTPALRAGLRSGRPSGTTGTLNKRENPNVHPGSHQQTLTEGSLHRYSVGVLSGRKARTRVYLETHVSRT